MKKVNDSIYVHKSCADQHLSQVKGYNKAKRLVKDFEYTVVKYNQTTGDFSFTFSPDFDTADEPLVSDSMLVKADGTVRLIEQQADPYIYHRKELFVEQDYRGFDLSVAQARSKLIDTIPNLDKTRIGRLSFWQANVLPLLANDKPDQKTIGQFLIVFSGVKPAITHANFAQYILSKKDIETLLVNWSEHTWELKSGGSIKAVVQKHFHPTARCRYSITVPIAKYLEKHSTTGKVLYHGVGRDALGAKTLNAESYDPFHPNPEIRKEPKGRYDEVHSHYTLNVVNSEEGREILIQIHSLLTAKGKAVISVRRDF